MDGVIPHQDLVFVRNVWRISKLGSWVNTGRDKRRTSIDEWLVFTVDALSVLVIGVDDEFVTWFHKRKFVVSGEHYIRCNHGIVKVGGSTVIPSLETVQRVALKIPEIGAIGISGLVKQIETMLMRLRRYHDRISPNLYSTPLSFRKFRHSYQISRPRRPKSYCPPYIAFLPVFYIDCFEILCRKFVRYLKDFNIPFR